MKNLCSAKSWFVNIMLGIITIALFITLIVRNKSDGVEIILGSNFSILILGFFMELGINIYKKKEKGKDVK